MNPLTEQSVFFRRKLYHVVFWLLYISLWIFIAQLFTPAEGHIWTPQAIAINCIYIVTHICASYTSLYYLIPAFLNRRKYWLFSLLLTADILFFGALIALGYYIVFRNDADAMQAIFQPANIIPSTIFSVATTVGLLTAYKIFQSKRRAEIHNAQLSKEKLEAELKYLKGQMNPHFMFNAINNIYFLIKKNPDAAGEMLLQFSDLLRYQLYDCNTDKILLDKELKYLESYIELQKIRKGKITDILYNQNTESNTVEIAPLLLMPFVENAFKYVSNHQQKKNYININVAYNDGVFTFSVVNTTDNTAYDKLKQGGIGIKNTKRRLDLIYGKYYQLDIVQGDETFSVSLKIDMYYADK